jgi:hypothetical protein
MEHLAVSGQGSTVLVAGAYGTMLQRRGETWTTEQLPTRDDVVATSGAGIGAVAATRAGWLLRRTESGWQVERRDAGAVRGMFGSDGQLFVVGDTVMHHDGDGWHVDEGLGGLNAVAGTSPRRVFAVGDRGAVLRWDGLGWQRWPAPSKARLTQVFVGPALVIVSGDDGTFVHDGERWHRGLRRAAVGCWGRATVVKCLLDDGTIWFLHHGEWRRHGARKLRAPVVGLWSGDGRTAVAVGARGTIWRFERTSWTELSRGHRGALRGVWGSGAGAVWAVGDEGVILERVDGRWRVAQHLATTRAFHDIAGSAQSDVYAVGDAGLMAHFDGDRWSVLPPVTRSHLRAVWVRASGDVHVAGDDGVLIHYDGTSWTTVKPAQPDGALTRFDAIAGDAQRRWLLGGLGGGLLSTGDDWSQLHGPPLRDGCVRQGALVGVGHRAVRHDGIRWHEEHRPRHRLDAVWCAPDGAWAVGDAGTIMRRDGEGQWLAQQSGTNLALRDVWGDGAGSIWAVGDRGAILRRVTGARVP